MASSNFSYSQIQSRRMGGADMRGSKSLYASLARVSFPRYGPECVSTNNTAGCAFITQGFQFLAEETLNGVPVRRGGTSREVTSKQDKREYSEAKKTGAIGFTENTLSDNYLQIMIANGDDYYHTSINKASNAKSSVQAAAHNGISQVTTGEKEITHVFGPNASVNKTKLCLPLGNTPDLRLNKFTSAQPGPLAKALKDVIENKLNSSRRVAYDQHGRYNVEDFKVPEYIADKVMERAKTDGSLLTFNFSAYYQQSLRYKYNNKNPIAMHADVKNRRVTDIHKLNVVAHHETGVNAGSHLDRNGRELTGASDKIKTVITRIDFDEFPGESGLGVTAKQERAISNFKDTLRFRSFEIAKHMVEDTRMWLMTNVFRANPKKWNPITSYKASALDYDSIIKDSRYLEFLGSFPNGYADVSKAPATLRYPRQAYNDMFKLAIIGQNGEKGNRGMGELHPGMGQVEYFPPNASAVEQNVGFIYYAPDLQTNSWFLNQLTHKEGNADVRVYPLNCLEGLYPLTPMGLMDTTQESDERKTIMVSGGLVWRPIIFEWEPTVHLDFTNKGMPNKATVVNVYSTRKDQEAFLGSIFDRARYYAVVFVVVDSESMIHYFAEATHDYKIVTDLVKNFFRGMQQGSLKNLLRHRVGHTDPQNVSNSELNNKFSAWVRSRIVPAAPMVSRPLGDVDDTMGLIAPSHPIFAQGTGTVLVVPELLSTDLATAAANFKKYVLESGSGYDPEFAKNFGFLAEDPREWMQVMKAKENAGNGDRGFGSFLDAPRLDGGNSQGGEDADPFPHSLRGIHGFRKNLTRHVALREERVIVESTLGTPLMHPAIIALVNDAIEKKLRLENTSFWDLERHHVMDRVGMTAAKRRQFAAMIKRTFPSDKSWGLVVMMVNILNNALSERLLVTEGVKARNAELGTNTPEQVAGYRFAAQTMLNNMPHVGELDPLEAAFVLEHDLIGKIQQMARGRKDQKCLKVLQGCVYAFRRYLVKNTDYTEGQLPQIMKSIKEKMAVAGDKWQYDNFFMDGSNSNTGTIKLFVFAYDDNNGLTDSFDIDTEAQVDAALSSNTSQVYNDILGNIDKSDEVKIDASKNTVVGTHYELFKGTALPNSKLITDYFDPKKDFVDVYTEDPSTRRLSVKTGEVIATGGGSGTIDTMEELFHDKTALGTNQSGLASTDAVFKLKNHFKHQYIPITKAGKTPDKRNETPLRLVGSNRTLITSSSSRAIKVSDVMMSLKDGAGNIDQDRWRNLCQEKDDDKKGIGIIWFNTGFDKSHQSSLTTDLASIATVPPLEPLFLDTTQIAGDRAQCVFFKFPGGCLVPTIQSFSLHMAYWNLKLGNAATMSRIYEDSTAQSVIDEINREEDRINFSRLFNERRAMSESDRAKTANELSLVGGANEQKHGFYGNQTHNANSRIMQTLHPELAIDEKPLRNTANRQQELKNTFNSMYAHADQDEFY